MGAEQGARVPHDEIVSAVAVGDLNHTGALDIVGSTLDGWTYAWDGLGRLLPHFPVLNGTPSQYGLSVPPPDTPYSFQPENVSFPSPGARRPRGQPQARHHPGRR